MSRLKTIPGRGVAPLMLDGIQFTENPLMNHLSSKLLSSLKLPVLLSALFLPSLALAAPEIPGNGIDEDGDGVKDEPTILFDRATSSGLTELWGTYGSTSTTTVSVLSSSTDSYMQASWCTNKTHFVFVTSTGTSSSLSLGWFSANGGTWAVNTQALTLDPASSFPSINSPSCYYDSSTSTYRIAFSEGNVVFVADFSASSSPAWTASPETVASSPSWRPTWRPDGSGIAYNHEVSTGNVDIYHATDTGSSWTSSCLLCSSSTDEYDLQWSGDGDDVTFTSNYGSSYQNVFVASDGGSVPLWSGSGSPGTNLTSSLNKDCAHPSWSGPGLQVVFDYYDGSDIEVAKVTTTTPPGPTFTYVTNNSVADRDADWNKE